MNFNILSASFSTLYYFYKRSFESCWWLTTLSRISRYAKVDRHLDVLRYCLLTEK